MTSAFPPVLPLTVTLHAAGPQRLPPFLGSALHGALSRALYRTVCVFPKRTQCAGCPLYGRCAYPALFETPALAGETLRAAGIRDQAPRPLVLAPDAGWTRLSGNPLAIEAGTPIPFHLTLIGRAIVDLPVITVALQTMARRGLGIALTTARTESTRPHRAAATLASVTTPDGHFTVYDPQHDTFSSPPAHCFDPGPHRDPVVIEFTTPLRLKHAGALVNTVTPAAFFTGLARRANALSLVHGSNTVVVDEQAVATMAASVIAERPALRRVHVTRYSARQHRRMQWPGLMGTLHWRGEELRELWPLLRFGELVQVGKGTALGFGRYRLVPEDRAA